MRAASRERYSMRSVSPGRVDGEIRAPHSKSVFQRAVLAAILAEGTSQIRAGVPCDDDEAMLGAARAMGVRVAMLDDRIEITGPASPAGGEINCRESGLCLRTVAAVASLFDAEFLLTAEGSLRKRTVEMVTGPLSSLGARCTAAGGLPPMRIRGPIRGGVVEVDGSISSQFVTGLMIALPRCRDDSEIFAPGLRSRPYVELTTALLRRFGVHVEVDPGWERFAIDGAQRYRPAVIEVEGDWSGAAFMLVAGATAGRVTVCGLDPESVQPDRRILAAMDDAGAKVRIEGDRVTATKGELWGFEFDAADCPDLFPPLVALALGSRGTTTIRGAARLKHKESDRGLALKEEFGKLGGQIDIDGDVMRIEGGAIGGGRVKSHSDHRIAMSLAIAALSAKDAVEIEGDESVSKSYPRFFDDLEGTGAMTR